jgi:MoaA/NifB/PqqE/SkfB family radical SAM enzyme
VRAVWLTLACNNACAFCPQQEARTSPGGGFFSSEAIQDRLREAARLDKTVALVGGEPTLHPELFAFARLAREAGAEALVVQTNGRRLAYSSYARGLVEAGVTAVDISLHGTTAAMHEFHTRTAGSFAQTLTGIGVARGAGLRVGVTCVLTRSNYRHAPELVRLAAARGARAVQFAPAQQLPGGGRARALAAAPRRDGASVPGRGEAGRPGAGRRAAAGGERIARARPSLRRRGPGDPGIKGQTRSTSQPSPWRT